MRRRPRLLITQEDIAASGAPNVAELMRLVPGMFVLQGHTTEYTIGLRGLDPLMNNRVLVLVDGRQIPDCHTGAMNLAEFAVNPGDLEKVEVIRGPGSTLYGANAMTGVINLTTKRPLDHPGFEASAQGEIGLLAQDDTKITLDFWLHGLTLGTVDGLTPPITGSTRRRRLGCGSPPSWAARPSGPIRLPSRPAGSTSTRSPSAGTTAPPRIVPSS